MNSNDSVTWLYESAEVDWQELSDLYRIAPLGEKPPDNLKVVFGNSRYMCFLYEDGRLIGVGRALADGLDCSYIADVAVHPEAQGRGLGKQIIAKLVELSSDHKKILLYANPGTEGFYKKLGFLPMATAMAIWSDPARARAKGLVAES